MMCNCISEIEQRLTDKIGSVSAYSDLTVKRVCLNGVAIFKGGEQMSGIATLITEPYGKGRRTSKEMNISFKYCPFCGELYEPPKEVE